MERKIKRLLSILLSLVMMLSTLTGIIPGMSLTAYADTPYGSYLVNDEDDSDSLPGKVVHFNGFDWYIIKDESTSATSGTVTLLAQGTAFGTAKFHDSYPAPNSYASSTLKGYLDSIVAGTAGTGNPDFSGVASVINDAGNGKLYLLSVDEAEMVPRAVLKADFPDGGYQKGWWLRTSLDEENYDFVRIVTGDLGLVVLSPTYDAELGVRPALKLDLSKVTFDSTSKMFSVVNSSVAVTGVTLDKTTTQTIDVDGKVSFTATVAPENASDKTVKWSVGGTNADAVTIYSDEACETPVTLDTATENLTVYAKGISAGSATVTCTSNADSTKSASCDVTVNAYAGNPYASLVNTTTSVKFSEMDWYIIADDSTAVDAGTVTLLSKDPIGASKFHESEDSVYVYSISLVKDYLDSLTGTGGTFEAVADAIVTVKVKGSNTDSEVDAKLWLLSTSEAEGLSVDIRKCSTALSYFWWLRSRGFDPNKAARVESEDGCVSGDGDNAWYECGVRPALKLDLSKVTFDSATKTFTYGSPAAVHTHDGITFTAWDSANSLPAEAGNYYLTKNVIIDSTWIVPTGENKLCLNGHGIRYNGSAETSVIKVDSGATLNLYDCDAETKHYITLTDGRGTAVNEVGSEGAMEINGGYITGGKVSTGGGVRITGGTFSMYGGTVIGCTAQFGGGVYLNTGAFSLIGGTITGCTAAGNFQQGGGVYVSNGSFTISGGSISKNSAQQGGGVNVNSGSFTMSGGSIDGNSASDCGGGVYLENKSASFTMSGGSINGNSASRRGGGVYRGNGQITLSDAPSISENTVGESKAASNLDLNNGYRSAALVIGGVLDEAAKIRVTMQNPGVFTSGWAEKMGSADPADYFISESPGLTEYVVKRTAEGEARLAKQIDINVTTAQHGTVTAQVGGVNATKAYQDETVTLNVTPDQGYRLKKLTVAFAKPEVTELADLVSLMGSAVFNGEKEGTPFTIKAENGNFVLTVGSNTYTTEEYTDFSVENGKKFYAVNPDDHNSEWMININNDGTLYVSFYPYYLRGMPNGTMPEVTSDLTAVTEGSKYTFLMTPTAAQVVAEFEPVHTHDFTYSATGATITATCSAADCPLTNKQATLTISATGGTYDGTTAYGATITDDNGIQGDAKVQYQKKTDGSYGTATEAAPTDAGDYKASITVGGATASVEYTIAQADPTANAPTGLTATYGQTLANVSLEGKNPEGNTPGTWAWADSTKSVGNVVTPAATFKATFTPDSSNYKTVENVEVTVTINKAAPTVTAPTAKTLTYTGTAQELVNAGSTTGGTMQYAIGTDDQTAPSEGWDISIPAKTNAGIYYVWYKVDPATNYNGVDPACIVVEIEIAKGEAIFEKNIDVQEVNGVVLDEVKTQLNKIAPEIANADNTEKGDNQIKDITVTLETKAVTANTVPKNEASAIMLIANNKIPSSDKESSKISYLNINVNKNVKVYNVDGSGMPADTPVTDQDTTLTTLPGVIDIPVKYDLTNLHNLQVVRYHGDKAEAFTKLDKKPTTLSDLTFFVEESGATAIVHIYTKEFSTYALITSGTKEYKNETSTTTPTEKTEPTTKDESVTVYRLYYGPTMEHFYTTSAYERKVLIDKYGWVDEGIAWKSPKAPTTDEEKKTIKPVYRLFNPFTTDHHYTKDPNERKTLINKYGWKDEGVAFYSNDKGDATVYRLWHPGLITGAHHFTTGKHEYDVLITRGWIGETEAFKVNAAS